MPGVTDSGSGRSAGERFDMGYRVCKLQNCSGWAGEAPTICIDDQDPGWGEAYQKWLAGQNPTGSVEWKKGVYALTQENNENSGQGVMTLPRHLYYGPGVVS